MENTSRRSFFRQTASAGLGAAAFTLIKPELVRGSAAEKLKAGLIGCGGRGTQAAIDTLTANPNVELTAMGDIFEDHLEGSLRHLKEDPKSAAIAARVNVDPEHRFSSFDAYKKVIASDVDIVMLCTPPGYRPEHFEAAVNAKKHVFCEKPIATDPTGVRRFMASGRKSLELKLSVVSGAQRHADKP
jgi:predicted dehydrogenase